MAVPRKAAPRVASKKVAKARRGATISLARAKTIARELIREMDEKGEPTSASLSAKDTATGSGKVVFHAARVLARLEGKPARRRPERAR